MFTAAQIKELMDAQPFKPFRIRMSSGESHDITNHDMAFVKRNAVEIGLDLDPHGIGESFRRCAIMHIASIEDISSDHAKMT